MDTELMMIQMENDFNELAEQYDGAAENELLFALGAPTAEATELHTQNVIQNREMAKFYRYLATRALDLIETFQEEN
jgi:uncharacterized membrane protein